jgi:hypothetical protein
MGRFLTHRSKNGSKVIDISWEQAIFKVLFDMLVFVWGFWSLCDFLFGILLKRLDSLHLIKILILKWTQIISFQIHIPVVHFHIDKVLEVHKFELELCINAFKPFNQSWHKRNWLFYPFLLIIQGAVLGWDSPNSTKCLYYLRKDSRVLVEMFILNSPKSAKPLLT